MTSGLPWGLALTSGVNTYIPLFLLALFARYSHLVHLSPRFQFLVLTQALVILGLLAACEVLAEKFPVLDNVWDFLHTLLRPLAGAVAAGATLDVNNTFETVAAMLVGGALAASAHSAKSSLRLASTSKTFGAANLALSVGEDAAVVGGTLLSVYAPWVMLVVVILFVLAFVLLGPRILRTLRFELDVAGAWLAWLARRVLGGGSRPSLAHSVLDLSPRRFEIMKSQLGPGEQILGALEAWRRRRGPRACVLGLTSERLLVIEPRLLGRPRVSAIAYRDLSLVRSEDKLLFSRFDLLTRQNESIALTARKTHAPLAGLAAAKIQELAGLGAESSAGRQPAGSPRLVSASS